MFDAIFVRSQSRYATVDTIDLGLIAELMLFYGHVQLFALPAAMTQLLERCGPAVVLELLSAGFLKISYTHYQPAVNTRTVSTSPARYRVRAVSGERHELDEFVTCEVRRITGKHGAGGRMARRLIKAIEPIQKDEMDQMYAAIETDATNVHYARAAAQELLAILAPEYTPPTDLRFDLWQDTDGLALDSNIDFVRANRSFQRHAPPNVGPLSPAALLIQMIDVRQDLHFAARYSAEIAADQIASAMIRVKCGDLLSGRRRSEAEIALFQQVVLHNARAVREAINRGERSIYDLLEVLEAARRFRSWLDGLPLDVGVVEAYYQEVTKSTWVDRLPSKTIRYVVTNAIGFALEPLLGPVGSIAAGLALSAADAFLLDHLVRGWRPNQFVEDDLADFLGSLSSSHGRA